MRQTVAEGSIRRACCFFTRPLTRDFAAERDRKTFTFSSTLLTSLQHRRPFGGETDSSGQQTGRQRHCRTQEHLPARFPDNLISKGRQKECAGKSSQSACLSVTVNVACDKRDDSKHSVSSTNHSKTAAASSASPILLSFCCIHPLFSLISVTSS